MSEQSRKEAQARFDALIAQARTNQKLAENRAFVADVTAANTTVQQTANAAAVASAQTAAPTTVRQTAEASHEQRNVSLDQWEAMLLAAADRQALAEVEIEKMQSEIKLLKTAENRAASTMEFDVNGKLKSAFTRDALDRMLETRSNDPRVQELKEANDQCATVLAFVDFARRSAMSTQQTRNAGFKVKAGPDDNTPIVDIKQSKSFKRMMSIMGEVFQNRALYSTAVNAGDEFVPANYSSRIYDYYQSAMVMMQRFQRLQMPSNPWYIPCLTSLPVAYIGAEKTADDSTNYSPSTPATDKRTLTAVKAVIRTLWSGESNEDSITAWTQLLDGAMGKAFALAEETAGLNGDTTATHFDTGLTLRSDDFKRAWAGLRHTAFDNASTAKMDLGTFTDANFMELLALMGKYAANMDNLLIVASVKTYLKYILANPTFATWDKLGGPAPNQTGTLGRAWNIPIALSGEFGADLDANGIYSAAGQTKSGILVAYTPAWIIGEKRGYQTRVAEDIDTDQLKMVTSAREIFQKLAPATDVTEVYGYNIG